MAAKTFTMTAAGKAELEAELEQLKTEGRVDIAENLKLPAHTVTLVKTVNMMKQNQNRQRLKQEFKSLNISLKMRLSLIRQQATRFQWAQR